MPTNQTCTATCVIDGEAVRLYFFPDTGVLRISDAMGASQRETRWGASWRALMKTFQEFSLSTLGTGSAVDRLFAFFMAGQQHEVRSDAAALA